VHYSAGAGTALSLAGARLVPGDGLLSTVARLLLDGAGALFGLYLLLALALSAYGWVLRRQVPGPRAAGLLRPAPARLPGPTAPPSPPPAGPPPAGAPGAPGAVPAPRIPGPSGSGAAAGRRA
jgi:hypothetical protein